MVGILDKFEVTKSNCKLCMLMACKNHEALYTRLVLERLKSSKPDFDRLGNDILEIQRLTRSGDKGPRNDKEVNLSSVDGNGTFSGKCFNWGKHVDSEPKNARDEKGT